MLTLRTNGRLLVVEQDGEPRWRIGIGERGVHPVTTDPGPLQLVDIEAVVQLVTSQLVRMVDVAERVGVATKTVASWRDRYRDFPAPVAPGPLWWWPHLVAAGFDRPQPRGRRGQTPAAYTVERPRTLTQGELAALFAACAADSRPLGRRDAALLTLLCTLELSAIEALGVDLGDYDPATGTLHVRHGRRHQQRTVYLDEGGRAALDAWLAVRAQLREPDRDGRHPLLVSIPKGGRLSPRRLSSARVNGILGILYERARQARVAPFTTYDLRRAVGSNLLDAGVDLSSMTGPADLSGWPPSSGVLSLRTDAGAMVVEQDGAPRWEIGVGERGKRPDIADLGHLQLVDMAAVVQLVTSQLVRIGDIAQRAGVSPGTVESWRGRYRDRFPAPVAPGPLWWWPHLVAAGFGRPGPKSRRGQNRRRGQDLRPAAKGDLQALLTVCAADPRAYGRRDAALLAVLLAGPLDYAEAIEADLDDYEAATGTLRVTHGSRRRLVGLDGNGRAALTAWLKIRLRLWEPDKDGRHPLFVWIYHGDRLSPRRLTISGVSRILTRRAHQAAALEATGPQRPR